MIWKCFLPKRPLVPIATRAKFISTGNNETTGKHGELFVAGVTSLGIENATHIVGRNQAGHTTVIMPIGDVSLAIVEPL